MENEMPKNEGVNAVEEVNAEIASEKTVIVPEVSKELKTSEPGVLVTPVVAATTLKPSLMPLVKKLYHTYWRYGVGVVVVVLLLVLAYVNRGLFIVAMVDGNPISRMSVVAELEKQSGKQALDALITKKLIEAEMKKKNITVDAAVIDEEIKKIETQVAGQGGTLELALAQQGMTRENLREQIVIQKELELLLADKIAVSDEEVTTFLKNNKTIPQQGISSDDMKNQVREQIKNQKFTQEAKTWVDALKAGATIDYFVQYK